MSIYRPDDKAETWEEVESRIQDATEQDRAFTEAMQTPITDGKGTVKQQQAKLNMLSDRYGIEHGSETWEVVSKIAVRLIKGFQIVQPSHRLKGSEDNRAAKLCLCIVAKYIHDNKVSERKAVLKVGKILNEHPSLPKTKTWPHKYEFSQSKFNGMKRNHRRFWDFILASPDEVEDFLKAYS